MQDLEKRWPTVSNSFFHKLYFGWIMKQFDVFIKISLSMNCVRALITGKCSCFFPNMHCPHMPFNLVLVGLLSLNLGGQNQLYLWTKLLKYSKVLKMSKKWTFKNNCLCKVKKIILSKIDFHLGKHKSIGEQFLQGIFFPTSNFQTFYFLILCPIFFDSALCLFTKYNSFCHGLPCFSQKSN